MKYAQLIRLLVGRELTLRYKRSVIGIGWTLLNPMLTSFVLWVVLVSHDMNAVRTLATRVVWLESGHVKMIGNPAEVVAAYEAN
jgi:ABC-type polysaccharide/polyol phosphate export permease